MRILIIDDNTKTRNFISTRLKSSSFAVDTAVDGKEGLTLAKIHPYDLIILDVMLPVLLGKDVLLELRKTSTTPIIILSGNLSSSKTIDLLDAKADDVIEKPFIFEELLARIYALLRRQKPPQIPSLHYKGIELDFNRSSLLYQGKQFVLTRSEFVFLELLLQNKGAPVSRQDIFSYVWDTDQNYSSNTVETHILNIRKKLSDQDVSLIETIPGKGYRIFV